MISKAHLAVLASLMATESEVLISKSWWICAVGKECILH